MPPVFEFFPSLALGHVQTEAESSADNPSYCAGSAHQTAKRGSRFPGGSVRHCIMLAYREVSVADMPKGSGWQRVPLGMTAGKVASLAGVASEADRWVRESPTPSSLAHLPLAESSLRAVCDRFLWP